CRAVTHVNRAILVARESDREAAWSRLSPQRGRKRLRRWKPKTRNRRALISAMTGRGVGPGGRSSAGQAPPLNGDSLSGDWKLPLLVKFHRGNKPIPALATAAPARLW